MRKDAREAVFSLLYRDLFNSEVDNEFKNKIYEKFNLTKEDISFADELYACINENKQNLLNLIESLSKGFMLNRIFSTDKCALLIGFCELTYFENVPNIVAIDEAVNLSKKYSCEKSHDFVNGILAQYKKNLEGV